MHVHGAFYCVYVFTGVNRLASPLVCSCQTILNTEGLGAVQYCCLVAYPNTEFLCHCSSATVNSPIVVQYCWQCRKWKPDFSWVFCFWWKVCGSNICLTFSWHLKFVENCLAWHEIMLLCLSSQQNKRALCRISFVSRETVRIRNINGQIKCFMRLKVTGSSFWLAQG